MSKVNIDNKVTGKTVETVTEPPPHYATDITCVDINRKT
jgi:hypothetical protein